MDTTKEDIQHSFDVISSMSSWCDKVIRKWSDLIRDSGADITITLTPKDNQPGVTIVDTGWPPLRFQLAAPTTNHTAIEIPDLDYANVEESLILCTPTDDPVLVDMNSNWEKYLDIIFDELCTCICRLTLARHTFYRIKELKDKEISDFEDWCKTHDSCYSTTTKVDGFPRYTVTVSEGNSENLVFSLLPYEDDSVPVRLCLPALNMHALSAGKIMMRSSGQYIQVRPTTWMYNKLDAIVDQVLCILDSNDKVPQKETET